MGTPRSQVLIAFIGTNGAGKTTIEKEVIQTWKRANPNRHSVVFDVHNQLTDVTDFKIKKNANWAKTIDEKIRNSLIVLDDYKILVDTYTPTEGMLELLINRRHDNNDYIYSCHSPADIIPAVVAFNTHFYIFYTKSLQGKFKERLPFSDLLIMASGLVNNYVHLHGMGKHPLSPEFNGPKNRGQKFPYAIVDTNTGTITCVNMNRPMEINPV